MDDEEEEIIVGAYPGLGQEGQNTAYKKEDSPEKTYSIRLKLHLLNKYLSNKQFVFDTIQNTWDSKSEQN